MSKNPILRDYVSPTDIFLEEFNKKHPKPSASQQKEIDKYKRIYRLRDDDAPEIPPANSLWEKF